MSETIKKSTKIPSADETGASATILSIKEIKTENINFLLKTLEL